jgi:hypothetical protein
MKSMMMTKSVLAALVAMAGGQLVAGCNTGEQDVPAAPSAGTQGIHGQLLEKVDVSKGHVVEFYDYGDGAVGAHEVVDIGDEILMDKIQTKPTLADIFKLAKPGAQVPRSLIDAQTRADAYIAKHPKPTQITDNDLLSKDFAPAAKPVSSGETDIGSTTSALTACSGDLLGDNWGAQWFLDNFCNEGCFRNCPTNVTSSNWNTTYDWFKWKVMAADFNVVAHTEGRHECGICASAELKWSYDVQPRKVDIHTMTSGYHWYVNGNSRCRMHSAALRCD